MPGLLVPIVDVSHLDDAAARSQLSVTRGLGHELRTTQIDKLGEAQGAQAGIIIGAAAK